MGTNAIPGWSRKDCAGSKAVVEVDTGAPTVELPINGKGIGTKMVRDCKATFKVKYEPGTVTAIAGGRTAMLSSAGGAGITVCPEKKEARPGEIVYVSVVIADEYGIVESNADRKLTVSVEGGELLGVGSANPRTEECFDSGEYTPVTGDAVSPGYASVGPRGGRWKSPKIIDCYLDYAKAAVKALSEDVQYWMTFNEPRSFIMPAYVMGAHAPFRHDVFTFKNRLRHMLPAHGKAVRPIRQAKLVRPLALGLLDGEEKEKAQKRLVKAVEHFHHRVGTGFEIAVPANTTAELRLPDGENRSVTAGINILAR